jgi:uncharacterized membrane protein YdjX (TVP38/TMEM64 family)
VLFWIFDLLDVEDVRAWVEPFGPLRGPVYVVLSALLGAALVPGPVLAGVSGVLFGAGWGTLVTIAASVLSAVISLLTARRVAGRQFEELSGPRLQALARFTERHGVLGVIAQRLLPAVPDAPCSYMFGLLGVRVWQIALGTAIGAAPRAFSYTSLGASIDDPSSPLAFAGIAGIVITGIVGLLVGQALLRTRKR